MKGLRGGKLAFCASLIALSNETKKRLMKGQTADEHAQSAETDSFSSYPFVFRFS